MAINRSALHSVGGRDEGGNISKEEVTGRAVCREQLKGGGTPASPGKGVSEMEEAVPLGLRPPQSPARREGARRQAQRGLRPSPNLVIRPLRVVFLLQKTLIYCNLKNDRDVAGDPAAGAREREIFLFCGELG